MKMPETSVKIVFSIIVSILAVTSVSRRLDAAPLDCIFEHYSSEDGLPHNSIADIHQDRDGYIWLCTWSGLSRFDGRNFVNYTTLPGDYANISHNRILSVDEDVNGYLWVTTYDYRLYRFDKAGEKFTAVPDDIPQAGITNARVEKFYCDAAGNAWIVVQGAGLCKVTPDLGFVSYFGSRDIGHDVKAVYAASDGTIFAVSEKGIASVKNGNVALVSRLADVVGFEEFGSRYYFATPDLVRIIDKSTKVQSSIDVSGLGVGKITAMEVTGTSEKRLYLGFSHNAVASVDTLTSEISLKKTDMGRVRFLFPDSEGLLWIATERTGIWNYNPDKGKFRHYEHSRNVMSYYTDTLANVSQRGGRTWVKMNGYGFGYYDREADDVVPLYNVKELPDCRFMNGVACFEEDSSGVLWFSTVQRGLERVTVINPKVEVVVPPTRSDDPIASSEVRAMYRDSKNNVWVATKSSELYRYNSDMTSCVRIPESGKIGIIYTISEDSSGNIWLGTKGSGLVRMTPRGNSYSFRHFRHNSYDMTSISSDNIYSVVQDNDGRIWVGTFGGGLSMLRTPDDDEFITVYNDFPGYPLEYGDRVRYLYCAPDGRILVATVGGLVWFYPDDNTELIKFHQVRKVSGDIHSLGNNDIIYIFNDNAGDIWLCTFGGGINRADFDGENVTFEIIGTAEGLSSNIVLSAICDPEGNIWAATETGISKIDPGTKRIINYTKYDGMLSTTFSEATCTGLENGMIAFGTLDNVYKINPSDFVYTSEPKRLTITGFRIDGKRILFDGGEGVAIPHDYSFFRIDYASLNFKIQENLTYAYKLDGYDKDWISNESATGITYSHIPHGRYEFMLKAVSGEGLSDAEIVTIPIRVKPSLWESTPALIFYVILILGIAAVLVRMFMTSVRLRTEIKLEQDLNDVKAKFFTNISHELRTPLTLILGGIDEISKDTAEGSRSEYSVKIVYKNARRMMTLVDQLLDIRSIVKGRMRLNVRQLDIVALVTEVYDDFKDMAVERNMELTLAHSVDSLMIWGDAGRLEALVYNLISNAFKYTPDGGRIEVGVYYREGSRDFTLSVKDNGIGVPRNKQEAIFEPFIQGPHSAVKGMSSSGIGLSFCKEIVTMHGGSISVESNGRDGAVFHVTIPVDRDHFSEQTAEFIEEDSMASGVDPAEASGLSKYRVKPHFPVGAMKVLVVEDNAELKVYIYNALSDKYEVRDAANGREAMDIITGGWTPDMIITDLMMPEMDGIELINRIRSDFTTSHIPIILITARHESDTHLKAMKYGADGYITKPFTMELLIARMENLMDRRKALLTEYAGRNNGGKQDAKVSLSPAEVVITDRDEELIRKVMQWLEENIADSEITVDNLAAYVGMGRTSMYNKLKGLTGKSPVELIQDYRLEKATYYLKSGQLSVSETSYKVGFSDPGYFSRSFKKHFGISPAEYIRTYGPKSSDKTDRNISI